jgi:hypothetical protein
MKSNRIIIVYAIGVFLMIISAFMISKENPIHDKIFGLGSGITLTAAVIGFKDG